MTDPVDLRVGGLIERSSFATPGARSMRDRTPVDVVATIVERVVKASAWPGIPDRLVFADRERELVEAAELVDNVSGTGVLLITGAPGSGKSAMVAELVARMKGRYPDGLLFVAFNQVRDQGNTEVLKGLLRQLGESWGRVPHRLAALRARYEALTAGKQLLVVLEDVTSASQIQASLPGDGHSLTLVTADRSFPELALQPAVSTFRLSPLSDAAAVELLSYQVDAGQFATEQEALGELVTLCGGLPLALSVSARMLDRTRGDTISSVVEKLRSDLDRRSPDPGRSLTAVLTAAYGQLSHVAQQCYRVVGLEPATGAVTAGALTAALQLPIHLVVDGLDELCESELLEQIDQYRYAVRPLIAVHAAAVDDRPRQDRAAESARLVNYYVQLCYDADVILAPSRPWRARLLPGLQSGDAFVDRAAALSWLERERHTVLRCIEHAFGDGDLELVLGWCVLLWPFYETGKHFGDVLASHECGIAAAEALGNLEAESLIRTQKGVAHLRLGELDEAAMLFTMAVECARMSGVLDVEAAAVEALGLCQVEQRSPEALSTLRRNLKLAQMIGGPRHLALAELHLAKVETPDLALQLLEKARRYFDGAGKVDDQADCEAWKGKHLCELGRTDEAIPALVEVVDFMAGRGRWLGQAEALVSLGQARSRSDDIADARDCWARASTIYEDLGYVSEAEDVRERLRVLPA